jgi:hypothetical protein
MIVLVYGIYFDLQGLFLKKKGTFEGLERGKRWLRRFAPPKT